MIRPANWYATLGTPTFAAILNEVRQRHPVLALGRDRKVIKSALRQQGFGRWRVVMAGQDDIFIYPPEMERCGYKNSLKQKRRDVL